MVRPSGRAAPRPPRSALGPRPAVPTPPPTSPHPRARDAASRNQSARRGRGTGRPRGLSLESELNRQLLLGWARRGTDPRICIHPWDSPGTPCPPPALLGSREQFLGTKVNTEGQEISSTL